MKKIVILIALSVTGYYAYKNNYLGSASSTNQYSISNIQNQPIPQENLF
jgi:uncharacterized membrane protein YebE (DUF533 family)